MSDIHEEDEGKPREQLLEEIADLRRKVREQQERLVDAESAEPSWYRILVENAYDVLMIVNADGSIRYQNPSNERFSGFTAKELEGKLPFEFMHPDDLAAVMNAFGRLLQNPGSEMKAEYRIMRKDGEWVHAEAIARNLLHDPEVEGIIVNTRDISERIRMEDEVHREREFTEQALDSLADVFYVLGPGGTLVRWNKAMKEKSGFGDEELASMSVFDFFEGEDVDRQDRFIETLGEEGEAGIEAVVITRDGRRIPYYFRSTLMLDSEGDFVGVCGVGRDMTEIKRAEAELRRSRETARALLDASPEMAFLMDVEGKLLEANDRVVERLPVGSRDELVGRIVYELLPPGVAEVRRASARGVVSTGEPVWFEDRWDERVFDHFLHPIKNEEGEVTMLAVYARDITSYRRDQEELQAHRDHLEQLVEERTLEIMERTDELRARNEELDAFAHTVSHDLRGSLSLVEGFTLTALAKHAERDYGIESECLENILRVSHRMDGFIAALLEYARMGKRGEPERVNPDEVLQEILLELGDSIERGGVQVRVQEPLPTLFVDRVRLRQVFSNLIENAIKYMGDSPRPMVEIGAEVREGTAKISVRDNGIGIAMDKWEQVFEPFYRLQADSERGLGIGLSTVKRAVESWDGEIRVQSQPGRGSTFYFTAPLAG